jgi:hypothetical protein
MVKQSAVFFLGFAAVVLILLAEGVNLRARLGKLIQRGLWFSVGAITPVPYLIELTLANKLLVNPQQISISISKPAEGVVQGAYLVYDTQKNNLIKNLLAMKCQTLLPRATLPPHLRPQKLLQNQTLESKEKLEKKFLLTRAVLKKLETI